jgi:hypothetical protein
MRLAAWLLVLFVLMAALHTWPLASDPAGLSRLDNDDTSLNVWTIAWVADVLPRDPFNLFNAPIFHPETRTLAYSEHMVVPSLLGAPLLWAGLSPVLVYNFLVLAGLSLSGWTMSLVVTRWTGSVAAGAVAGLAFAFNAHLLTRIPHLQALHVEFFPLALYALDEVLTRVQTTDVQTTTGSNHGTGGRTGVQTTKVQTTGVQTTMSRGRGMTVHTAYLVLRALRSAFVAFVASRGRRQPARRASTEVRAGGLRVPALLLTLSLVLQGLCSNYSLVFLTFTLALAAVVRVPEWVGPGRWRRASALAASSVAAAMLLAPFLWPYYLVSRQQDLARSIDEVRLYSAGVLDYLTTGGRLHYTWWSHRYFEGRTALFPGVVATALALTALSDRILWRDPRVRMTAAMGALGAAMSFGPALAGYAWLHEHVPLLQGIRGAARWGFLLLVAVAMLAGYGVARLERRWAQSGLRPAAALAIAGAVTIEALRAPMAYVPVEPVPVIYDRLRDEPGAVLVEFPLYSGPRVSENARYLVANTRSFRPLVNGYSGFEPPAFRARAERWRRFPAPAVVAEMRALGVTHVMVHTDDADPEMTDGAATSVDLALVTDDGRRRLYRLPPRRD